MRCILDGHWSSCRGSHTGPAQCVESHLASSSSQEAGLSGTRPCCAMCNAGALPLVSPDTNHTIWSHQQPPGHRAAPPCGVWPCQAISSLSMLCNVISTHTVMIARLQHAAVCHPVAVATCAVIAMTMCIQLSSCRCSTATMHCASKQRELRMRSPKCTSAALEMSPTEWVQCAEHGSMDG
jgi:hypothetical protein